VRKKIAPKRAKNASEIAMLDALKRGLRKSCMSSIGCGARRSQATKASSVTSANAKAARMVPLVQPRDGASVMPHTSEVSATNESENPRTSSRGADSSRLSGTRKRPASSATITTGTLTRKIQLQSACSISHPPVTGPIAIPMPENPDQMPIAFPRSCAGNVAVRIESVDGMMNAPPMPIRPRVAISSPAESASADPAEPRPKISRPSVSARLRPKRSPSEPAVSSTPAKTSM
jgi:hypothetical protein